MGKALIIGSTVCDVVIYLDKLPTREGDEHIQKQFWNLGGCAFNVAYLLQQLACSYTFLTPVGSGQYGTFVRNELDKIGMGSPILSDQANGCCYCFVERDGERTFLSEHGVEYTFQKEWLDRVDLSYFDYLYICGLEVEEPTGEELIDALADFSGQLIFAPGPRGHHIPKQRLERLYSYSPILHLNEQELLQLSEQSNQTDALSYLAHQTQNSIVVTLGSQGALFYDKGNVSRLPAYPSQVTDTIGAGDSHVAAFIAGLISGKHSLEALDFANLVASHVVSVSGVQLPHSTYQELKGRLVHD